MPTLKKQDVNKGYDIMGSYTLEKAFGKYPSYVPVELYDVFLKEYPFEKGCWNKGEFYRMVSESYFAI